MHRRAALIQRGQREVGRGPADQRAAHVAERGRRVIRTAAGLIGCRRQQCEAERDQQAAIDDGRGDKNNDLALARAFRGDLRSRVPFCYAFCCHPRWLLILLRPGMHIDRLQYTYFCQSEAICYRRAFPFLMGIHRICVHRGSSALLVCQWHQHGKAPAFFGSRCTDHICQTSYREGVLALFLPKRYGSIPAPILCHLIDSSTIHQYVYSDRAGFSGSFHSTKPAELKALEYSGAGGRSATAQVSTYLIRCA